MTLRTIPKTFYGYAGGEVPIAVAVVTTDEERAAARSILGGMSRDKQPVVELPGSPWLVTRAENDYTRDLAFQQLQDASARRGFRAEFADVIPVHTLERFLGDLATRQVLGRRLSMV